MRTCSIPGCDKAYRAKGLCSTHYNHAFQPQRHARVYDRECAVCGTPVRRKSSARYLPTCSYQCRRDLEFGISEPLPADHWARWYGATCAWEPPRCKVPRFIDSRCADCDTRYLVDRTVGGAHAGTYCSSVCQGRANRRRRRGREHGLDETFRWAEVIEIWLRQGRRCAYCDIVPDGQPDPDHVVALSRGGRNRIFNILPCCRSCNSDKADLTLEEWKAERERLGKPAVRTDFVTYDARAPHLVLTAPSGDSQRLHCA